MRKISTSPPRLWFCARFETTRVESRSNDPLPTFETGATPGKFVGGVDVASGSSVVVISTDEGCVRGVLMCTPPMGPPSLCSVGATSMGDLAPPMTSDSGVLASLGVCWCGISKSSHIDGRRARAGLQSRGIFNHTRADTFLK
jgi:hypothetical protein